MKRFLVVALLALLLPAIGCGAGGPTPRVILLGLDGMDPDVIDLLIAEGKLPHFAQIKREGAYARLYSAPPLLSPIIWTTIATGRKPSDHGIGHFITVDPSTGEELPVTSAMRRVPALWNIFSAAEREVAIVGWWATWPAEAVNGVVVSDHAGYHFLMEQRLVEGATSDGVTYPDELLAELDDLIRRPQDVGYDELEPFVDIEPADLEAEFAFHDDLSHFRWALGAAKSYRDIGLRLWETRNPDLLLVYVEGVDTTSHLFGHLYRQSGLAGELAEQQRRYGNAVEQMYVFVDGIVGDYIDAMDENTTLVIVSDHGFKLGELPTDPSKTRDMRRVSEAYHREYGILFLYGRGVQPGARIDSATTLDVTPSVLALAGLPLAEDMPGKVFGQALDVDTSERIASYDDQWTDGAEGARSEGVDHAVLERLESLGYIGAAASTNDRNLANILLREGRYEEAAHAFGELAAAEPDEPVYHAALGTALAGLGRLDEARESFGRALEIDPLYVPAYHNRGLAYERQGDRDAAIRDYRTALRYKAEYEPARLALERLGVGLVGRVAATDEERRAAELLREASALMRRGDYGAADGKIDEAQALAPDAAVVFQYRSNVAYLRGDHAAAAAALERALAIEPDNALFRENLRKLRETEAGD